MGRRIASESKQTVRGGPKPAKVGLHRRLGCGMTLGKSNRNRYLIGCRDHQCCRHINACFLRELRVVIREERIINVYQIWNAKSNNINRRI